MDTTPQTYPPAALAAFSAEFIGAAAIAAATAAALLVLVPEAWRRGTSLIETAIDPREPTVLRSGVPFLKYMTSMLFDGDLFWHKIRDESPKDAHIVTLPLVNNGRMYIVTKPSPLIRRFIEAKNLRLAPLLPHVMTTWGPLSSRAVKDFPEFLTRWFRVVPGTLTGNGGEKLHTNTVEGVRRQIEAIARGGDECEESRTIQVDDFAKWVGEVSARALLGGFAGHGWDWCDQEFLDALGEYEWSMIHFGVSPAPSLTAPEAYKARDTLMRKITPWVELLENDPESRERLSSFARTIFNLPVSKGWSTADKAGMMLIMIRAALSNEVPTIFWMMSHIYSRPQLLAQLREEAEAFLFSSDNVNEEGPAPIKMTLQTIEAGCPLLYSCYKETQRLGTVGPVVREVLEETVVNDGERDFLLKKGSVLSIPMNIIQTATTTWGDDAGEWVGDRFLREVPKDALFPFGFGRDKCPANGLASNMLCWMMLLVVMGIDIESADGKGGKPIEVPDQGITPMSFLVPRLPHRTGRKAKITRREAWDKVSQRLFI